MNRAQIETVLLHGLFIQLFEGVSVGLGSPDVVILIVEDDSLKIRKVISLLYSGKCLKIALNRLGCSCAWNEE
jgi:hypothetical protein